MDELEAAAAVPDETMDIDGGENARCTLNDTDHYRVDAPTEEDFDVLMHDDARHDDCEGNGQRGGVIQPDSNGGMPETAAREQYVMPNSVYAKGVPDGPDSGSVVLTHEKLMKLLVNMIIGGKGHPGPSGREVVIDKVTNELAHLAKTVVLELYETRRSEVRWVIETAQLDQEEALAYLLADLLAYELLPGEGRSNQHWPRYSPV